MSGNAESKKVAPSGKVSLANKLAFACGDIFGGGSFNIINFLFTPFLTLVVGIPMVYLFPILLITKIWDGVIDPFIGKITDAKQPGRFGKRRIFMLVAAPFVLVCFILLFFPWNLVTENLTVKIVFVIICYMMYATAQSFVLIPYYSHASEMTDDFSERNRTNAVRLGFSVASGLLCVVVPGMITSYTNSASYIVMAAAFGVLFTCSILVAALFSKEQIVTPAVKTKLSVKEFLKPLKVKTYRQYLGMQMCNGMGMAVMSSFFYTFCDFYLRRASYYEVTLNGYTRFPIATVAAALMFVAQIFALPLYTFIIKKKSKRFAYILGASVWIVVAASMWFLQPEAVGGVSVESGVVTSQSGSPNWLILMYGLLLGLGIGGAMYIPHSAFGDVCDVGELYFGKRTEGAFSGLTNFLNTAAQALGLALPPLLTGIAGYKETQYVSTEVFNSYSAERLAEIESGYKITQGNGTVQLIPLTQSAGAQTAIRVAFIVIPVVIMAVGIAVACRYRLTKKLQQEIVSANALDKNSEQYKQLRADLLSKL